MTNPVKPAEPVVDSPELRRLVGDYMHDCQMVRGHAIPSWRRLIAHITGLVKDECTLCNGMGMLDGAGSICPHCDGTGTERALTAVAPAELRAAAAAVVERWDSPKWKDEPHTAVFIDRLRLAIAGQRAPASIAYDTQFGALLAIYAHATLSGDNENEFKRLVAYVDARPSTAPGMKKLVLDWWMTDMDHAEFWNRSVRLLGIVNKDLDVYPADIAAALAALPMPVSEYEKAFSDLVNNGTGVMLGGIHVPAGESLLCDNCGQPLAKHDNLAQCAAPMPASEAASVGFEQDHVFQNMMGDWYELCNEDKHAEANALWKRMCAYIDKQLAAPCAKGKAHAMTVKDHVLREVVNSLRDIAVEFHGSGQLRARLRAALDPLLAAEPVAWMCPDDPDAASAFKWARKGVDYAGLSCDTCGKKHVPVFAGRGQD